MNPIAVMFPEPINTGRKDVHGNFICEGDLVYATYNNVRELYTVFHNTLSRYGDGGLYVISMEEVTGIEIVDFRLN